MKIAFSIDGLPPKKDGANSMWRKGAEMLRLKALRREASRVMRGKPLVETEVHLKLCLYAAPSDGDLDNFIAGICDGLMAAHPLTPIDSGQWTDVHDEVHPSQKIVYTDDLLIASIQAQRFAPDTQGPRYEIKIEWD